MEQIILKHGIVRNMKNDKKDIHKIAKELREQSIFNQLVDGRAEWKDGYNKGYNQALQDYKEYIEKVEKRIMKKMESIK